MDHYLKLDKQTRKGLPEPFQWLRIYTAKAGDTGVITVQEQTRATGATITTPTATLHSLEPLRSEQEAT